ncbi:MAG: helix-turn-helix domain-containing protein, partial [Symbiobacteriaceae bacterium]|nr:helix-turn-helix domain-containing protein [Symbiobacteriaceae bacterium]
MFDVPNNLKRLRKEAGLTVGAVVEELKERYGIAIATKTLYGWENNSSIPNGDAFLALCQIYGVSDPFTAFSRDSNTVILSRRSSSQIFQKYTRLPTESRRSVDHMINEMTRQNDRIISLEAALEEVSQVR